MTKKTKFSLIVLVGVFEFVLGFAGGAEYVMRRVDALDKVRAANQEKSDTERTARTSQYETTAVSLSRELFACQATFAESTVIYERPPQLSIGFAGPIF